MNLHTTLALDTSMKPITLTMPLRNAVKTKVSVGSCAKCKQDTWAPEDEIVSLFVRGLRFHRNLRQLFDYVKSEAKTMTCLCHIEQTLEDKLLGR